MSPKFRRILEEFSSELGKLESADLSMVGDSLLPPIKKLLIHTRAFRRAAKIALDLPLDDRIAGSLRTYGELIKPVSNSVLQFTSEPRSLDSGQLVQELTNVLANLENPQIGINSATLPFLPLMAAIQAIAEPEATETEARLQKLKAAEVRAATLIEQLETKAAKVSVERFAEIFGQTAQRHSSFSVGCKKAAPWIDFAIGKAEIWLGIGFVALVLIPIFVFWLADNSNLDWLRAVDSLTTIERSDSRGSSASPGSPATEAPNSTLVFWLVSIALPRLILLSVLLYIVRFAFREYGNNMALATQNSHRQSVLHSSRLLLETVEVADADGRAQILKDIAASIYIQGRSPYDVSGRKGDTDYAALLELIRLLRT